MTTYRVEDRQLLFRLTDAQSHRVALQLLDLIKQLTPVQSGKLRDGWQLVWDSPSWVIYNDVRYARAVEFGSSHVPAAAMMGHAAAVIRASYGT